MLAASLDGRGMGVFILTTHSGGGGGLRGSEAMVTERVDRDPGLVSWLSRDGRKGS